MSCGEQKLGVLGGDGSGDVGAVGPAGGGGSLPFLHLFNDLTERLSFCTYAWHCHLL